VFTLEFAGVGPVAVVAEPRAALRLLEADPASSHAGETRRAFLPQASPRSSFGADERRHAQARSHLQPGLDGPRLEALGSEVEAIAERHVDSWPRRGPVRVLSRLGTLTQEIFVRCALGVRDQSRAQALVRAMGHALRTPGNPPLLPPARDRAPWGRALDVVARRRLKPVADVLSEEIDARRRHPRHGDGILDVILDEDPLVETGRVVAELVVVLAAAQEPPAIALAWMLDRLAREEGLRERFLASEPASPFRDAVRDETLRLDPPALAALRRLTEPLAAGGHELAAGTDVMVPIPLVHRDPGEFPRPEAFLPQRFIDGQRPSTFMPFGGGARRCPGEALAKVQIQHVAPMVLDKRHLRFPSRRERAVQRATVLVPNRSGLALVV
jgi:cytochrome P450